MNPLQFLNYFNLILLQRKNRFYCTELMKILFNQFNLKPYCLNGIFTIKKQNNEICIKSINFFFYTHVYCSKPPKNFKKSHLKFKHCFLFLLQFSTIFHHLPIYRTKDTLIYSPSPRITLLHRPFYSPLPPPAPPPLPPTLVSASLPSCASHLIWTILVWEMIIKFENSKSLEFCYQT